MSPKNRRHKLLDKSRLHFGLLFTLQPPLTTIRDFSKTTA
jgi:hypothetical protein